MKKLLLLLAIINTGAAWAQKMDSLPPRVYYWDSLVAVKEDTRVRRQVMEGSTTALSYLEVHTSTLAPGMAPHPPHAHDDMEELMIVKEGQVKITINGVSRLLGPGSIAFAMAGEMHGIENGGNTAATYFILKYKSRLPMDKERAKKNGGSFMLNWNEISFNKTEKGGRREFFNRPTSQLEKFEMHTTALKAGLDSHAPHTHKEEEIILMLSGNPEMNIDDHLYKVKQGDVIFLSSRIPHSLQNTGATTCEYFAFQWRN
jgi:(S)-ureidoglycine aminohydrolase